MIGTYPFQYPSGRWGFSGRRVPMALMFRCSEEEAQIVQHSGPRLARLSAKRHGRPFESITFDTKADAIAALNAYLAENDGH